MELNSEKYKTQVGILMTSWQANTGYNRFVAAGGVPAFGWAAGLGLGAGTTMMMTDFSSV